MTWGDPSAAPDGPRPSSPTVAAPRAATRSRPPSTPPAAGAKSSTPPRSTAPVPPSAARRARPRPMSSSPRSSRDRAVEDRCDAPGARAEPRAPAAPTVDLYMHHYPSRWVSIPRPHEPDGRRRRAGQGPGGRRQQLPGHHMRLAPAFLPIADPARLESGPVIAAPPSARDQWRPRCVPRAGGHPHRQPAPGQRRPDRQVRGRGEADRVPSLHAPVPGPATGGTNPVVGPPREIGDAHGRSPAGVALRRLVENEPAAHPGRQELTPGSRQCGALAFPLNLTEIEALDRATSAWRATDRRGRWVRGSVGRRGRRSSTRPRAGMIEAARL